MTLLAEVDIGRTEHAHTVRTRTHAILHQCNEFILPLGSFWKDIYEYGGCMELYIVEQEQLCIDTGYVLILYHTSLVVECVLDIPVYQMNLLIDY